MLIDFSFANHKSYRDPQQFSMTLAHADDTVFDSWGMPEVATVAAVYGANASGKSAFLDALTYIPRLLYRGLDLRRKNTGTGRTPYLLDTASRTDTSDYLYTFIASDGKKYLYEVSLDDTAVLYESLKVFTTGNRTAKLFERAIDSDGSIGVTYGRLFAGQKRMMISQLRGDRLLLGIAGSSGAAAVIPAFDELVGIRLYPASGFTSELRRIAVDMQASPGRAEALSTLVGSSSLGIESIKVDRKLREAIERCLEHPSSEEALLYRNIVRGLSYITMPDLPEEDRDDDVDEMARSLVDFGDYPLLFLHVGADGSEAYLGEDSESRGTQAALAFLSLALDKLAKPTVTLVDEIDTSLHPTYVEQLVGLFTDPRTNPHQSQLIFTTHDITLITRSGADERPLSRDQVWIAAKEKNGVSTLYPITSFKHVRKDENLGRNYLHGVYGGLPTPLLHESFAAALDLIRDDSAEASDV